MIAPKPLFRLPPERRQTRDRSADGWTRIRSHHGLYDRRSDEIALDKVEDCVLKHVTDDRL